MKKSLAIGLLGSLVLGLFEASAELEVSGTVRIHAAAEFNAPLAPHGAWVEVKPYGHCWHPTHVVVGWRPYCDGQWIWTDCGWYWASDEPWAWACYHYGGWVLDPHIGWVWIPGVEWAPAWVSWRIGGGHCGWAPLPPPGHRVVIAPAAFVFVESRHFHERVKPSTVIVNNTTIVKQTTQFAALKQETRSFGADGPKKVLVNEGPGLAAFEKETGKQAHQVSIREADRHTPFPAPQALPKPTQEQAKQAVQPPAQPPGKSAEPAGPPKGKGKKVKP